MQPKRTVPERPCHQCGKLFRPSSNHQPGKYCSRACQYASMRYPLTAEWFESMIDRNGPIPEHAPALGRCWIWKGRLDPDGYGVFNHADRFRRASRLAMELAGRPIPETILDADGVPRK